MSQISIFDLDEVVAMFEEADGLFDEEPVAPVASKPFRMDAEFAPVIKCGSGFVNGRARINACFAKTKDLKERADFLKHEYGIGGWSWTFTDGSSGMVDHDAKGLRIRRYTEGYKNPEEATLPWTSVALIIDSLMAAGEYPCCHDR